MSWRATTQSDVDNTTYSIWIRLAQLWRRMRIGDLLIDSTTSTNNWYQDNLIEQDGVTADQVNLTTGNNSADTDIVLNAAIPAASLPEGVIVIADGSGGLDWYRYLSWTGSTFTLDTAFHPTGLVRTYSDAVVAHISRLRPGFTIWMDSVALDMENVDFNGLGIAMAKPNGAIVTGQFMSTYANPIVFAPLRGPVIMHDDCTFQGFEHLFVDGDSSYYPGMRNPFSTGKFMKGSFGFQFDNYGYKAVNNLIIEHATDILTTPSYAIEGPSLRIRGIEAYGGFATIRVWQGGNANDQVLAKLFSVMGNYMHDGDSEGLYIGHTGNSEIENPRIEMVMVGNNLFARRGTESIQIQSFLNNSVEHRIFNNVILGSAADWIRPFQAFQSGTHQYVFGDGNVIIENNIVDSYIDNIYGLFGNSNGAGIGDISIRRNFQSSGWVASYHHGTQSTLSDQIRFLIEQNWHIKPDSRSADRRKHFSAPTFDYLWGQGEGTAKMLYKHIETEAGFPVAIFENEASDHIVAPTNIVKSARNAPAYMNTGLGYDKDSGDGGGYDFLGVWDARIWPVITVSSSIDSPTNPGTARFGLTGPHELSDNDTAITSGSTIYSNGTFASAVTRIDDSTMEITGLAYTPKAAFACTGGGSSTSLQDTVNDLTTFSISDKDYVLNVTDGSVADIITVDDADNITTSALTGGSDNTWQSGDSYEIVERYAMYIGSPMEYLVGEIVSHLDWDSGTITHPGVKFYKCILQHSAAALSETPATEPTRWELIQWDDNAVRSDKAGYGTPAPGYVGFFPPDNALIEENDQWNKKGVGLLANPTPTDATYYTWYYCDDKIHTNDIAIVGAKTDEFDIFEERYDWIADQTNKYLVFGVTVVDKNGYVTPEVFGEHKKIASFWMEQIIQVSDYGWTPIPTVSEPDPLTTDKTFLVDATYGDDIRGLKTIGQDQPSTSDLPQVHEDFSAYPGASEGIWCMEGGVETPEWIDRPDDAPFLLFRNGRRTRFGVNIVPTPDENPNGIDMIFAFRYMPCVDNETIGHGLRNRGTYMEDNTPVVTQDGDTTTSVPNWLEDQVYRVHTDPSQNWRMWKNKVLVGTGTGADISSAFVYIGSNGHPAESHYRYSVFKNGEFGDAALDIIYTASQKIAPWTRPKWPHIDEQWFLGSQQWDSSGMLWDIWRNKTPIFRGGNGIAGTYSYQWYYWDDEDPTKFPLQNKIDEHKAFGGADGQNSTLVRAHYYAGNARGNEEVFFVPGTADNVWVACKVTVRDSDGVVGIVYLSGWTSDNITPIELENFLQGSTSNDTLQGSTASDILIF